ncbi:MAG: hypothetical protein NTY48_07390 [Candidatus Diapherotrites archaeon]|nr:hypothetical protein [Candidatus Diapherotrites archaeon]
MIAKPKRRVDLRKMTVGGVEGLARQNRMVSGELQLLALNLPKIMRRLRRKKVGNVKREKV